MMRDDVPRIITLALDAGGTALKAAVLVNGRLLAQPRLSQASHSERSASVIIAGLADACEALMRGCSEACSIPITSRDRVRIGFAFPGPFDYAAGIALLQGVGKYEALYGKPVGALLQQELQRRAASPDAQPSAPSWAQALAAADIRFANDAALFALGVSRRFPAERLLCLTLGTGLGSAFIANGALIAGQDGVPQSGMLYAEPFRGAPADDQFGRRGILALAAAHGMQPPAQDVRGLALAAQDGDPQAVALFRDYGQRLGTFLQPYAAAFSPSRIVLGGQISKSSPLWMESMRAALALDDIDICIINDNMEAVYKGIAQLYQSSPQ